ncbi:MAG: Smr/MutS family protein [Deltaproteobacteria bacterium]|nr:Smr/MutS family protein [Deltaproteobacteria bacterium]
MTTSKSSGAFSPFEKLKELLEKKSLPSGPFSAPGSAEIVSNKNAKKHNGFKSKDETDHRPDHENEMALFLEAMADVKPMRRENRLAQHIVSPPKINAEGDSENETMHQLNMLIKTGEGFVVKNTPEYIEGTGHNVHPKISTRLHRGDFSIQAHVDLHGFGVVDARNAFEFFIKDSITTGKRAVLIVHGRGLSSPDRPVLKTKVVEWLTRGPMRKWVIAFSSARSCDGGAGATYVLLRQRPLTKRFRKKVKHH